MVGPAVLLLVGVLRAARAPSRSAAARPRPSRRSRARWCATGSRSRSSSSTSSAAGTIGALVLACFALRARDSAEFGRALDVAAGSAGVMTVASRDHRPVHLRQRLERAARRSTQTFSNGLSSFVTSVSLGQAWLGTTLIAAAVTVLCFAVRNQTALVFVTVLAMVDRRADGAAGPRAEARRPRRRDHRARAARAVRRDLAGRAAHARRLSAARSTAAGSSPCSSATRRSRSSASSSSRLRLRERGAAGRDAGRAARRRTASWCWSRSLRSSRSACSALTQRRFLIGRLKRRRERAQRSGGSSSPSSRSWASRPASPPRSPARRRPCRRRCAATPTPAEILTGEKLPPELTFAALLHRVELRPALGARRAPSAIFFYLAGVWRLRRRGDRWPVYRTVLWMLGHRAAVLHHQRRRQRLREVPVLSAHMLGAHGARPWRCRCCSCPGAPVTLGAARDPQARRRLAAAAREWILLRGALAGRAASSPTRSSRRCCSPASLWAFYYTPLFRWATTDHIGHEWMIVHFLITGYLFVQSLIGIDPVAVPAAVPVPAAACCSRPWRSTPSSAWRSCTSTGLLLADWFGAMGRTWGATPLVDQQTGGGIAWSIGEIPTVILAIVVAIQWSRSDERETKRQRPQRRPHGRRRAERVQRAAGAAGGPRRSGPALSRARARCGDDDRRASRRSDGDAASGASRTARRRCAGSTIVPSNSDCTVTVEVRDRRRAGGITQPVVARPRACTGG